MEAQNNPPSLAELNATRRLIDWLNRERALARGRTLRPGEGVRHELGSVAP